MFRKILMSVTAAMVLAGVTMSPAAAEKTKSELLSITPDGKWIEFNHDGKVVKSKISGSRTEVTIDGAKADRTQLKAGMVCKIEFVIDGDRNEPSYVDCSTGGDDAAAAGGGELAQRFAQLEEEVADLKKAQERGKPTVSTRRKGATLKLSGRVNFAFLYGDNGTNSEGFFVDNDNGGSRFGFDAENSWGSWKTGLRIQFGVQPKSSDEAGFSDGGDPIDIGEADEDLFISDNFDIRHLSAYVEHPKLGRLQFGQTDSAGNGYHEKLDKSGTSMLAEADVDDTADSLEFGFAGSGDDVGDFYFSLDPSRDFGVRYDSPSFHGFHFEAGASDQGIIVPNFSLLYEMESDSGLEFSAGVVAQREVDDEEDGDAAELFGWTYGGSASLLLPFGLNFTFAGAVEKPDDEGAAEQRIYYGKIGYRADWFEAGQTRFYVDFFDGRPNDGTRSRDGAECAVLGDPADCDRVKARSYSGGIVQVVRKLNTEFYAGVRVYDVDVPEDLFGVFDMGDDPDNIIAVLTGARVRF